jgi:hypothetical protein
MKITMKLIESLNPCEGSLKNAKIYYSDRKSVTYAQFLGLKNIPQSDKVWVSFKLMDKNLIRFAAADIAELSLHVYESKYPNDNRPRAAIEAARAIPLDKKATDAADAAADAARAAAYAGTPRAAYAARAAAYAAYAARAAYAADDAARAAAHADAAAHVRMEKQIKTILLKYLNKGRKKEN